MDITVENHTTSQSEKVATSNDVPKGSLDQIGEPTDQWPDMESRPCYGVYEQWLEIDGNRRKPGVYYHNIKDNSGNATPSLIDSWICSPLYVRAITHEPNGFNYGRMLEFITITKAKHIWFMPMYFLGGNGAKLRRELLSMGCDIDPQNWSQLPLYLQSVTPEKTHVTSQGVRVRMT